MMWVQILVCPRLVAEVNSRLVVAESIEAVSESRTEMSFATSSLSVLSGLRLAVTCESSWERFVR